MNKEAFLIGYMEKKAVADVGLGAILGGMKALPGQGWSGAGYGALKGLGTGMGVGGGLGLGAILGALSGAGVGALTGSPQLPVGIGAVLGGLGGAGLGGYGGYNISDALLKDLYGKKRLEEIFGKEEEK